jgi:organic radical activating enzyme
MAEQSKTYCPLPFMHSHAGLNGKYKPCCNANSVFGWKYHTEKLSYKEWFDHPEMEQLRTDLLNGVQNKMCHICWKQEEGGRHSYRHSYIKKYKEDNINIHKPEITYIDIKLSNECNLGCRHCDYTNTTQIHKDMVVMEKAGMALPAQWQRSPGFEKRLEDKNRKDMLHTTPKKVVDELIELMPTLKHLKVTGGEPTITKEFFHLVDYAVENGYSKNINLYITTNGTRFTKDFLKKLSSFKQLFFSVSCDGFGETYEYIRYPYTWKQFEKRINAIADYMKNEKHNIKSISLNCVAQMQNLENIHKIEMWVWKLFGRKGTFFVQPHINPYDSVNEPNLLPKQIFEDALENIKKTNAITEYDLVMYIGMLENTIKNYDDDKFKRYREPTALKTMKQALLDIDKIRNQDYRKSLEKNTKEWVDSIDV